MSGNHVAVSQHAVSPQTASVTQVRTKNINFESQQSRTNGWESGTTNAEMESVIPYHLLDGAGPIIYALTVLNLRPKRKSSGMSPSVPRCKLRGPALGNSNLALETTCFKFAVAFV